jgi:outer membrane protein assembly factor BamB
VPTALGLALAVMMLTACPGALNSRTESVPHVNGELTLHDGDLTHAADNGGPVHYDVASAQPYQIVCLGPPALVTTVAANLSATTYALAADGTATAYVDQLPLTAAGALAALAPLTLKPAGGAEGLTLLNRDGTEMWSAPAADLLQAIAGGSPDIAYVAIASRGDALYPFGGRPELAAVDLRSGTELWRSSLEAVSSTVDIMLWGVTSDYGLLSIQYDFEAYEFVRFDVGSGELLQRHRLTGQPMTRLVYPGPTWEPVGTLLNGTALSVAVLERDAGPQFWEFDLATGGRAVREAVDVDSRMREENPLAMKSTLDGDLSFAFPQRLLPTASGGDWSVPALVNGDGEVLIISDGQALWR